jgi:multicomponent Na+:H+ antiporter subunit D
MRLAFVIFMVNDTLLFAAPILLPLAIAFLLPLFARLHHELVPAVCILTVGIVLLILLSFGERVFDGEILVAWMGGWTPRDGAAIGISLSIDAWGLLVALVIAIVSLMALVYSLVYMHHESGKEAYYVLFMLLVASLTGFCLSGDLFNQFVWLEIFSVAAFSLTAFHVDHPIAVEAAFKYLVTNSVATFFIVIGLTLFYMQTGALNIAQVARDFETTPAGWAALAMMVGGYGTKAALVPWHFWLPDAHSVAPAPISAVFSGALVKVGMYAVGRTLFTLTPFEESGLLQNALLFIAALTMLTGGIQMLQQQSMKRILAFSSVSQMGYILLGLAVGTPLGLAAAALHIISHALAKSALFLCAGMIGQRSGIHTLDEGGGLARRMPLTCIAMIISALSLSGMPLFGGYVSKTMLEEAAFEANFAPLAWVAILSSILTFAGLARLIWSIFGGAQANSGIAKAREAPALALLPIFLLTLGSLVIGLFPNTMENISSRAGHALQDREHYLSMVLDDRAEENLEFEAEHLPSPYDWHHWHFPVLVILGGSGLAYLLLYPPQHQALRPARILGRISREWHSGLVTDYALWNAFGTATILVVLVLADYLDWL